MVFVRLSKTLADRELCHNAPELVTEQYTPYHNPTRGKYLYEAIDESEFTQTFVDEGSVPVNIACNLLLAAGPMRLSERAPSLFAIFYGKHGTTISPFRVMKKTEAEEKKKKNPTYP